MEDERDVFKLILRTVVETYGMYILNDVQRLNAILLDYAPEISRERKLIVNAVKEGIGSSLIDAAGKNEQERRMIMNRCIRGFIEETCVADDAARLAVEFIMYSLGIGSNGESMNFRVNAAPPDDAQRVFTKDLYCRDPNDIRSFSHGNKSFVLNWYQTIGYKAIAADTSVVGIVLPQFIRVIKPKAFVDCINLKSVTLPPYIEEIGAEVFAGCDSLETIVLKDNEYYAVESGMLIDKRNNALMKATRSVPENCVIPPSVKVIHPRAFERNNAVKITLPKNLTTLDGKAFVYCGDLQCFEIDPQNELFSTIDGVIHTKDGSRLLRFPTGYRNVNYTFEDTVSHIENGAFSAAANLETITFTSTLRSIGARAFEYCGKLSSLVLPSSVEVIGERAFQYCGALSSVMLPRSIKEIGDFAFCGCTSIETVSVPREVRRIGNSAFKNCSSLKRITIQDLVEFIGDGAFEGCEKNIRVLIRNNNYVENYCYAHGIYWDKI